MNLEEARAQVQLTRTLAPRLYATSGGHDLDTDPALIHPPAWMCHPCQGRWGQWAGAEPTATQLNGGGEKKRRQLIAHQREDIAAACHQLAHERTRTRRPAVTAAVKEMVPGPLGARVKGLLDEFEALLPADGRTREQKITAAVEAERRERRRYEQTRQPWTLTSEEDTT